jgi:hypothetical protein
MQNKHNIHYIFGSRIYYPSFTENQNVGATPTDLNRNNLYMINYPGSYKFGVNNTFKPQFTINYGGFITDTIKRKN